MTRKPDRFERMVKKGFTTGTHPSQEWIYANDAIDLLRREHRAVVRIIKKDMQLYRQNAIENARDGCDSFEWDMKREACEDILDRLHRRAR